MDYSELAPALVTWLTIKSTSKLSCIIAIRGVLSV